MNAKVEIKSCSEPKSQVISCRAGTKLKYVLKFGNRSVSREIDDVCHIFIDKVNSTSEETYHEALSLSTGISSLGKSVEEAYSNLIYLLLEALLEALGDKAMRNSESTIGRSVSKTTKKKSDKGTRIPKDRQMRGLLSALGDFIKDHPGITIKRIEQLSTAAMEKWVEAMITTDELDKTIFDETIIDVEVCGSK